MRYQVRYVAAGTAAVSEAVLEAGSPEELRARCTSEGWALLAAVPAADRAMKRLGRPRFDVAWWCRELCTLLRSGMTVVEAIETLAASRHDAARDQVHAALVKALRQGHPLSQAMLDAEVFPQVLVAGVKASERTSTLAAALDDYLRYDEMLVRLKRQATSAAIYPALVVSLGVLISLFLLVFVIPRFSRIYVSAHGDLSAATQAVLWLSRLLAQQLPWVIGSLVLLGLAVAWSVQRGDARRMAMAAVETVEPLRRQWDQFRLAKLYQSLALMFRGGYTVDEALAVGESLELGPGMSGGLARARQDIARGKTASAALAAVGLTETVTERLLAVGERTGGFDTVLQTIADRHAQAFATFVERATRIVEPLLLLIVALVVGGIVVMMYMPIFDMANSLGGGR